MLKKPSAYFALWILFQSLVEINCQMIPLKRYDHTATLIDNKLYILGGDSLMAKITAVVGKEFFYLDVSVPFNTQNLLWQDLSSINTVPTHYDATSVKGGANNHTLILYGGSPFSGSEMSSSVYTFDPQSNSWSTPNITGVNTIRKNELIGIIDNNGKMYLWGGEEVTMNRNLVDDMLILDTINLNWWKGSSVGAPTPRSNYGAVLLPDRKILYTGGRGRDSTSLALALNEVYLYDIDEDKWSTQQTSGNVPSNRNGFSTILGLDGQRVIIFGGNVGKTIPTKDSLYVLDTSTFEWYIPKVSGSIPSNRYYHTANVIGKYMIVSFGIGYDQSESDILLLDISNNDEYIWTNGFDPTTPSTSPPPPSPTSPSFSTNTILVISLAIVGSLIVGGLLVVLYKWGKNKQKRKIVAPTPVNEVTKV